MQSDRLSDSRTKTEKRVKKGAGGGGGGGYTEIHKVTPIVQTVRKYYKQLNSMINAVQNMKLTFVIFKIYAQRNQRE